MDPIIPQSETVLTPEPKHFLNKKFAITFVILLLLGTGAYAGIWYWGNKSSKEITCGAIDGPMCPAGYECKYNGNYPGTGGVCVKDTTVDETADWKTYTNTQYGFEFKYPSDFHINEGIDYKCVNRNCLNVVITNGTRSYGILINPPDLKRKSNVTEQVFYNGIEITKSPYDKGTLYEFSNGNNLFIIATVSDNDDFYNQILSTFKFTDQGQVACTQEAKQCSDGSYVGRTGPNCEFAACSGDGTLTGHVTIGPNCPVEQAGNPCTPSPQAYTSRQVIVYAPTYGSTVKAKQNLDVYGNYSINLSPGTYYVTVQPAGTGPQPIFDAKIIKGQTTTMNFSIDTGIR